MSPAWGVLCSASQWNRVVLYGLLASVGEGVGWQSRDGIVVGPEMNVINTRGTRAGPGSRERTLAVKSKKNTRWRPLF